jgi:hypothetical protein
MKNTISLRLVSYLILCNVFSLLNHKMIQASDFHSPRIAGLGGAGHASPLLNDSIYMNPSYVAFLTNTVSIGMNYLSFNGSASPDIHPNHGRSYNFSIQDGRSDLFQAGVGYTRHEEFTAIHVGAARSIVQRLGIGIGSKFHFYPTHESVSEFSLSATAFPFDGLQVAMIVDNLLQNKGSLSHKLYREFTLGFKYNLMGMLLIYADPHYVPSVTDGQPWGHESGIEFVIMRDFFLRGGIYSHSKIPFNSQRGDGYGAGFGWIAPKLSLDYAYSKSSTPVDCYSHVLGMTVYY